MEANRIGRLPEVQAFTGLSRSTIYARIQDGLLTLPVPLGGHSVGWPIREISAINEARISGRTDNEIRALVVRLETERSGKPATPRRKDEKRKAA